jgi:hypothetical protein
MSMVHTEHGYMTEKGLHNRLKKIHMFYDKEKAKQLNLDERTLVTPITPYKNAIRFSCLEFDTLIDSSNITLEN